MKRSPQQDLDPKTIDAAPEQVPGDGANTEAKKTIVPPLFSNSNKPLDESKKLKPSFFNPGTSITADSGTFLGNLNAGAAKPVGSGLFTNQAWNKPAETKPAEPAKPEPAKQASAEKPGEKTSIFSGLFAQAASKPGDGQSSESKTGGLFGGFLSRNKSGEGAPGTTTGGPLFGNTTTTGATSGGLFSRLQATAGFFTQKPEAQTTPKPTNGDGDDDDDGDDDPNYNPSNESPKGDPSQPMADFKYNEETKRILMKNVEKFKGHTNPLLFKGSIALEQHQEKDIYFIIYRDQSMRIKYQGYLHEKFSKPSYVTEKKEAIKITCVKYNAETQKWERELCKIMFSSPKDCEEFTKQIQSVLKC